MTMRNSRVAPGLMRSISVLLFVLAGTTWIAFQYFRQPANGSWGGAVGSDGSTRDIHRVDSRLPDFSVSAIGELAGAEFAALRELHLRNFAVYRRFRFEPIHEDRVDELTGLLSHALEQSELPSPRPFSLDGDYRREISRQVILRLLRAGGLPRSRYLSLLEIERLQAPDALLDESYMQDVFEDSIPYIRSADQETEIARAFDVIDDFAARDRRCVRLTAVATDPESVLWAGAWSERGEPMPDLLSTCFDPATIRLFTGAAAQGQLVFTSAPVGTVLPPLPNAATHASGIFRAEVAVVVQDQSGDCYPMSFRFEYDSAQGKLRLMQALRRSSPRVMASLPFAL